MLGGWICARVSLSCWSYFCAIRWVLRRSMIFERVWGFELIGESNVIDVTIKNLRRRLEEAVSSALDPDLAPGRGYALREEA